ncbi:MAG: hypothetical protein L0Y62_07215 [Nitrospirae bacterium]|nr:hypothetical protein [Nitrospirota bacterium]
MKRLFSLTGLLTGALIVLFGSVSVCAAQTAQVEMKGGPIHPLCKNCHQPDTNMLRGVLENIAYKSQTIQMDMGVHKEIVKFSSNTAVKNLKDLDDIKLYKGKGFRIHFVEKKGEKHAVLITRFDILQAIKPEDKLTKEEFKKFIAENKNAMVFDARPPAPYQEAHIPGAKLLPAPAFDKFYPQVLPQDKNTPIVYYCVGGCLSPTNFMRTKALGYANVKVYTGGFPDWVQTDYAVTTPVWLKTAIETDMAYVLIDLRPKDAVKSGHIKTAVSISLSELDKAKGLFPKQKNAPIILYGDGKEDAAKKVISWGYKGVRLLPLSFDDWKKGGNPVASGDAKTTIVYVPKPKPGTVTVDEFKKIAANTPADTLIIDVREPNEAAEGKIKSAINIPTDEITHRLNEIPKDKKIVLHCSTGIRAEMAFNALKNSNIKSKYLDAKIDIKKDGSYSIKEN